MNSLYSETYLYNISILCFAAISMLFILYTLWNMHMLYILNLELTTKKEKKNTYSQKCISLKCIPLKKFTKFVFSVN